jgi:hypothetical protein
MVSHLYRLRISMADRAGALAQAATIVGLHGGNIMSIDVHRTGGEFAVDDLVVEFSGELDVEDLRVDLATHAATTLVSHEASHTTDPVVASMRRVVKLAEAGTDQSAQALADAVADLCSSPVAWVSSLDEAVQYDAGRLALERLGSVVQRTTDLPGHLAERLPGEVQLLAVPDAERQAGGRVVFVARPVDCDFTATEIARIEALADLQDRIERLVNDSRGS